MASSYTGMFLRQYMGQSSSAIPNSVNDWQNSPDLMVYGTAQAYTTGDFNNADNDHASRSWRFSQPPTPGSANYVYLRGLSLSASINATVYLYYCDATTLLEPQKWKSDTFEITTNGVSVSQNHFPFTAISYKQYTVSYYDDKTGSLITWTPPSASPAPHYYLIAWIDNTGSDNPPFAKTNAFTTLEELGAFVTSNTNMVFLDTWNQGIFLRQFPGQTNYQEGTGEQTSPDIIVTNITAAQDASSYATMSSYNASTLYQAATQQMKNFIYIRGLNTGAANASARVYLFYTTPTQIAPATWQSDTFTVAGVNCNYVDITADANGIAYTTIPIVWSIDAVQDYILIAYVDNSGGSTPPDFSIFGYVNSLMVEQFVATQPCLAWLKVTATAPAAAPDMSENISVTVDSGAAYVGLQFNKITTAGTVSFAIPGETGLNTLVHSNMHVPEGDSAVVWPVTYDTMVNTSLVLNFWSNGGTSGNGATITPITLIKKT
jgi:hypothetical protein